MMGLVSAVLLSGIGMEQALANAGPAAMIADPRFAIAVVEIVELEPRVFTNAEPPAGAIVVKESLRGEVKLDRLTIRWRPYPHGFDTPDPEGIKKWQRAAFDAPPVTGQTRIVIGYFTEGHFEVIPRDLPIEKRAWVVEQLEKAAKKTKAKK